MGTEGKAAATESGMSRDRTIGQLAKDAGVGVETIRFYERRGLLARPAAPAGGGYRRYSDHALVLVRYIRIAKTLGLALADVEALLPHASNEAEFCSRFRATLEAKLKSVDEQLLQLSRLKSSLSETLGQCLARPALTRCPILHTLHSPLKG
jgi:MerR family copper efflux transcriptional regulator